MRARSALAIGCVILGSACTSGVDIDAGPATITTNTPTEGDAAVTSEPLDLDEASITTSPVTASTDEATMTGAESAEEAAGLIESTLPESPAPLVTTPDDVEPRGPIGADSLERALIDRVSGFDPVDDALGDRFLDIDDAAALQPDPTEELPLLETRGYQGGWTRAFRNTDNDVIVTTVYDFVSALEADFYLEDGTITIIGNGGTIYEVESLPEARGFKQETTDASGPVVIYGITFTRDNQWYLVYLLGDPASATPDVVLDAASAQYAAANNA